ncbi:Pr6Pr family membrane protein [Acholeplasma manati]|uniref:Pr6Pr family membrane protein n=1 Tax=Paracholeplasma manati TaxID=591373 RepID=A0ABT2Y5N5_9MOLU|nr:Pr6Pr family membrane protein [Paracholeplasma manati]MCV2231300.1 Pr6Pr family membrane protein [Paracholeplasma manati]
MITNTKASFIYKSIYLVIGFIGLFLATEIYTGTFNDGFFVYYTNLSNLVAFSLMAYLWFIEYQILKGKPNTFKYPSVRFVITIMILVTLIIYNTLLGNILDPTYWRVRNVIMHLFGPMMVVIDFLLFNPKNNLKWRVILESLILPYLYVIVTLIIGLFTNSYPYFFLDVNNIGYGGVLGWVFILTLGFLVLSLALVSYNKFLLKNRK